MEKKIQWKKIGGGTFRLANGKIIKPNQVFKASSEEIPLAFRDVVMPMEEIPPELVLNPIVGYDIFHRGVGWYDVIETVSGKAMNEKPLRGDAARQLLLELS